MRSTGAVMVKKKTAQRILFVDLLRFIACIFIVYYHAHSIIFNDTSRDYYFSGSSLFVELFLMLTGYFTFKHFLKTRVRSSFATKFKNSLSYTANKFKAYIPYILLSVLVFYILLVVSYKPTTAAAFFEITDTFFSDLFLLGAVRAGQYSVIWYLSAVMLVFPLFCTLCQMKNKTLLFYIMSTFCVLYYLLLNGDISNNPLTLLRAFAGLSLGALLYPLSEMIKKQDFKKWFIFFLSAMETICFIVALSLMAPQDHLLYEMGHVHSFNVVLFMFAYLALLFSGKTWQSKINFKFFSYLGVISLPIYIFHPVINYVVLCYFHEIPAAAKAAIIFVGSIVLAIILERLSALIGKSKIDIRSHILNS